jgi:hypothetical protein
VGRKNRGRGKEGERKVRGYGDRDKNYKNRDGKRKGIWIFRRK